MRIQKFLREKGVGSLRNCDEYVAAGLVKVNGKQLQEPTCYLQQGDRVTFRGEEFVFGGSPAASHIYLKLNKPAEVLSSKNDKFGRTLVYDLLTGVTTDLPLFYAGRLDFRSRGLMIFSTDGDFINRLSHPSFQVTKEYVVTTQRDIDYQALKALCSGFTFESVQYSGFTYQKGGARLVTIILNEGKKQEVRNIIKTCDNRVKDLVRVRIGEYKLGKLPEGKWEYFSRM